MKKKCDPKDYLSRLEPTWCRGCVNYQLLSALTQVFCERKMKADTINVISGIGCSSRLPLWLNTYGMHTLHGRALPIAIGSKLAKPDMHVLVVAGDGDLFSIGIGHFVHAARKNFNITVICVDNRMFAMTKNQASPTSAVGHMGSLTPFGKRSVPLNIVEFAIACEASFVASTFAGNPGHMKEILDRAVAHKGFSFVHVLSPCITFEKKNRISFFRQNTVDLNAELGHDPSNKEAALFYALTVLRYDLDRKAKVPVGVFWKNEKVGTFESGTEQLRRKVRGNGKLRFPGIWENLKI